MMDRFPTSQSPEPELLDRYLHLLGVPPGPPSLVHLTELVFAQLTRIPFENISKLYYLTRYGLKGIPDLGRYLDGIDDHHFGGTCYSNNPYFNLLLRHLGYDAVLYGADMSEPDVHIVNRVRVAGRPYLVDVGYGAPFATPMPLDLDVDQAVEHGNDRYVLKPRDIRRRSRLEHHRRGEQIHGYLVKPQARAFAHFEPAVTDSFRIEATFMNEIRAVKFFRDCAVATSSGSVASGSIGAGAVGSVSIRNLTLVRTDVRGVAVQRLSGRNELVMAMEEHLGMPPAVVQEAIGDLAGDP